MRWLLAAVRWVWQMPSRRRARWQAEKRRLNALLRLVDLDLTARGIEHPKPPYIR